MPVAFAALLAACAAVGDGAAPGTSSIFNDEYDGATIVRQVPVGAGVGAWEDWTVLGFEWRSKFPSVVVLTVGTKGVVRVVDVVFEIDGEALGKLKAASELTDYGEAGASVRWSTRRFETDWETFQRIAGAKVVRMLVTGPNEAAATSFGKARPGAPVNAALPTFVAAVRKLRGEEPR